MVIVSAVAQFHTLEQLIGDVRVPSSGEEGGEPVHAGEDSILYGVRWHVAGPAQNARYAEAALEDCSFGLREGRGATIRPGEEFSAVVCGENDNGVVVQAKVFELLHHQA